MDLLVLFCTIIVIVLILFLYQVTAVFALKQTAHKRTGDFWFVYHLIPRKVRCPDLTASPYWGRFPSERDQAVCPTIDDPVLKELADTLSGKTRFMTERGRAKYILAFIQQNVTYRLDSNTFGKAEVYAFPVCTLYLRGNDCEDSGFLGACLCKLVGLDAVVVRVTGHIAYGVNVKGWGKRFAHGDKTYVWCEGTGVFPMGWYTGNMDIQEVSNVVEPSEDYIETSTYEGDFTTAKR